MKSVIATAALGAALFGQAAIAGVVGHAAGHRMAHAAAHRRAATPVEAAKRSVTSDVVEFLTEADEAILSSLSILTGANVANSSDSGTAVTIGGYGGAYVVEFTNESDDDLILVVWDSALKAWVNVDQPAITRTIKSNHTVHISFDPSVNGGSVSGGWAMINSNTSLYYGEVGNTWGEYTFEETGTSSTIDISRLITMSGSKMEVDVYETKSDAQDSSVDSACYADMETCAYVCKDGADTCWESGSYEIINCASGEAGHTTDASGTDGGCAGMDTATGYIVVKVY